MDLDFDRSLNCDYVSQIYNLDSGIHTKD
jgi:hypothetical protein